MFDPTRDRFWCWLTIRGRSLVPDEVTASLGVRPDQTTRAGDVRRSHNGEHVRTLKDWTWCLESAKHVSSNDPLAHLHWLMSIVDADAVNRLPHLDSVSITLFVETRRGYVGFDCPRDFVAFAARLRGEIGAYVSTNTPAQNDDARTPD